MTNRPDFMDKAEEAFDRRTALRREQHDEVAESWFGLGVMTDGQFRGGLAGLGIGAVVGALVFLPLGLFSWAGIGLGWRLAIAALCGAIGGATALAVYLGGGEPELEGEMQDVDGRPSIGTTCRDPHADAHGR